MIRSAQKTNILGFTSKSSHVMHESDYNLRGGCSEHPPRFLTGKVSSK